MEELHLSGRVQAEIKRLVLSSSVTPEFLHEMVVDERIADDWATTLAVRVVLTLMGRLVSESESSDEILEEAEEIGYYRRPATWWEGLKWTVLNSSWAGWMFPEHAIVSWVRYEVLPKTHQHVTRILRKSQHYHICPFPAKTDVKGYVNFMTWGEPFTGTHQEYVLLKKIARESVFLAHRCAEAGVPVSNELWQTISDYITENNRLAETKR